MSSIPPIDDVFAFHVGQLYSSDEIQLHLQVGNAGGVRVSLDDQSNVKRVVVLTSISSVKQASENPYHDRTEGNVLVYTGAGKEGNQSLAGSNKRLVQQITAQFPIYGFESIGSRRDPALGPKRWRFIGLLEYLRHYPEMQLDVRQQLRQVWLFEFFIHRAPTAVQVSSDLIISRHLLSTGEGLRQGTPDDREVVNLASDEMLENEREAAVEIESERVRLLSMPPREFEHLVQRALVATGFERVQVTKYSQDGGIDVNAYASHQMWPIHNLLIQVQAKRWLHTVGRKEVAELRGSLQPFARGVVVTTSHFSKAAMREAGDDGKNPIVLIDGYRFANTIRSIRTRGLLEPDAVA